ncbi:MAG TPA: type II secretion system protein GspJ [Polyangiaceae bacterium]|nr:type II secretion system protein GspJ [Polyangiaceae bacterium]
MTTPTLSRLSRATRPRLRGFTLVELLVAISILAMISVLIYSTFASMKRSREGLERGNDRYREGRLAMARITRELSSAFISLHTPIDQALAPNRTAFKGTTGTPADRVDFTAFAHLRIDRNSHESDQAEVGYFGSSNPAKDGTTDLVRRLSTRIDGEPDRGGRIDVLATDIDLFDLQYLDPLTGQWVETWDTTQAIGQKDRLPLQIRVILVMNGGRRSGAGRGMQPVRFTMKVAMPMQRPLTFATQ